MTPPSGPLRRLATWLRDRLDLRSYVRLFSATFLYGKLDERLGLDEAVRQQLRKPVPARAFRQLWCMGGISLLLFLNQLFTGVLLLVYYKPGPTLAYQSVQRIMEQVPLGWLIRQMHAWGAHLMVLTVLIHMFKVFIAKAYRPPRELNWMVGTVLFLMTFAFAFTGYLLPWDQLSFWATTVGTESTTAIPLIGHQLLLYLRGGAMVTEATLSRFFVVHTVVLPWVMVAFLVGHFGMIRRQGLSQPL